MKILERTAWTQVPNRRASSPLNPSSVKGLAIHYPAMGQTKGSSLTQAQVATKLEAWRRLHTSAPRSWKDIGYNFAIDQAGRVWYLTGFNIGAHANTYGNPRYVGVLMVLGDNEKPTPAALQALKEFRAYVLGRYPGATEVKGHQEIPGNSTSCPGKPMMEVIRSKVLTENTPIPSKEDKGTMDPQSYWLGAVNPSVKWLKESLRTLGYTGFDTSSKYGSGTKNAVKAFQQAQGWSGSDADGLPGPETLKRIKTATDKLKPTPTFTTHTVKKGETLTSIAKNYGDTVPAIVKRNAIKNANLISVGHKLKVKAKKVSKPEPTPTPAPTVLPSGAIGADYSQYQGTVNWPEQAKAGIKYALLRQSHSKEDDKGVLMDSAYKVNATEARKAGLYIGHYNRAFFTDGKTTADFMVRNLHAYQPEDPIVYDFEALPPHGEPKLQDLEAWATRMRELLPEANLFVYGSESLLKKPVYAKLIKMGVRLWVARWNKNDGTISEPKPVSGQWPTWTIWQYTSKGKKGSLTPLDLDWVKEDAWKKHSTSSSPEDTNTNPPTGLPTVPPQPLPGIKVALDIREASLQFSDSTKHQTEDTRKLFTLQAPSIIGGTEAGPGSGELPSLIKKYAEEAGYKAYLPASTDCWITVRKTLIKPGTWKQSFEKVIPRSSHQPGAISRWGDKGLVRVEFTEKTTNLTIAVYALHGLTKASTQNMSIKEGSPFSHQDWNRKLIERLEQRIKEDKKAGKVAIFLGDFNQVFNPRESQGTKNHALFNTSLISTWQLAQTYPNTGHGNIDGIGWLSTETRLKLIKGSARAWNDHDYFLHTDHFLIGAVIELRAQPN